MDGSPIKGLDFYNYNKEFIDEIVPIRMYLSNYDLGPTLSNVNNKFQVKYFISLVLVDYSGRRYFKQ